MAPLIYLVRHAEGENNINDSHWIPDPVLTEHGKKQCKQLQEQFPYHEKISVVMSSPLRRAIQTAVFSFTPTINRPEVDYLLVPMGQEVSGKHCDRGHNPTELKDQLPKLLAEANGFDVSQVNLDLVEEGWNSKTGKYAPDPEATRKRAADLRTWFYQRKEPHILFVTHGAFLHYLTEDWTGDDPTRGTAYLNCEVRIFNFTPESSADEAHLIEHPEDKARRTRPMEQDPSVLAEIKAVENS